LASPLLLLALALPPPLARLLLLEQQTVTQ
jgi:hypothetical protein